MGERKHWRNGDEEEEEEEEEESAMEGGVSGCKRFRRLSRLEEEQLLIRMLLEETGDEPNVAADEEVVCGVMKSLEEEISSSSSTENVPSTVQTEIRSCITATTGMEDLSYLVSASDDELGIPPSCSDYSAGEEVSYNNITWFRNEDPAVDVLWHFQDYNSNWLECVGGTAEYDEGDDRYFSLF